MTARLSGGVISIVEATPAPGWTAEIDDEPSDEARVDFEQGDVRVRVKFEIGGGSLDVSVERD